LATHNEAANEAALSHGLNHDQWYKDWFDNHFYVALYRHRSQSDADRAVSLFQRIVPVERGSCVLDVCCGAGRHVRALLKAGYAVAGVDLSPSLLALAREELSAFADTHDLDSLRLYHLLRGDMREPLPLAFSTQYDAVTNFFTSFGYFDDADNQTALRQMGSALREGGWLFFDFLNAASLHETLIAEDASVVEGLRVVQKRTIEAGFVKKHIVITDQTNSEHVFTEQVRLYEKQDLEQMFAAASLRVEHICGDYDGSAWSEHSPRVIFAAQRGS
jgi:SAM-dependent methyltransferase